MSKRITKILLPKRPPVAFAKALSELMTGFDDTSESGRFVIVHILEATWGADQAINLTTVYHRMNTGVPASTSVVLPAESSQEARERRSVIRGMATLCDNLPDDPLALNAIQALVTQRWHAAMRLIAADHEPMSTELLSLLATFGVFSGEPHDSETVDGLLEEALAHNESAALPPLAALAHARPGTRVVTLPPGVHFADVLEHLKGNKPLPQLAAPARSAVDPSKPALKVFSTAEVVSVVQRMPATPAPGEGNAAQRRLLDTMANDDGLRPLSEVPQGTPLAGMYEAFPHFKDVLDLVSDSLALAGCGEAGRPALVPPILLRGEPGTGKTFFAQTLADVLGLHFVERDIAVTSEAFVLNGMDAGWKNSKPGVVFDALVNGKTGNPLVLLNEVDKASTTGAHNSPLAPMYALLEPTSSRRFTDEFIPVPIDASKVIWVLTANKGDIPEPILSRLEVFDIRMPNPDECRAIAASVWRTICETVMPQGHGFHAELGAPMLDYMSKLSPRIMRKALTRAAGIAAAAGRKYLLLEDLESGRKRYELKQSFGPGFLR